VPLPPAALVVVELAAAGEPLVAVAVKPPGLLVAARGEPLADEAVLVALAAVVAAAVLAAV
jgi:hypothetical protein